MIDGHYKIGFRYTKDASVSEGDDTCWVDNINIGFMEGCASVYD